MKIQVFAVLKDYFEPEFKVNEPIKTVAMLKDYLAQANQQAVDVLNLCRFAVDNEFVNPDYELKDDDTICIFPPSSGG